MNIYKNYSSTLITILLVLIFIIRVFVGIIISINILSFDKNSKLKKTEKRKIRQSLTSLIFKITIGTLITIAPLFLSNNYANKFINDKLNYESEITNAKIYNLQYWNGHLSGSKGYEYEFYIKNKRYTGKHIERNGKVGRIIEFKYYRENPWINKKTE